MRRPSTHLRDFQCKQLTVIGPSIVNRIVCRISEEQPLYRCFECERKRKGAASLGRHLRKQHLLVPLRRGLTFTAPFGFTAEQCRRLTDGDSADAALLAPRRRGVRSDTAEGVRLAKKRKGPSATAMVAEGRLSGVLRPLAGSTLAAVLRPTTQHPRGRVLGRRRSKAGPCRPRLHRALPLLLEVFREKSTTPWLPGSSMPSIRERSFRLVTFDLRSSST